MTFMASPQQHRARSHTCLPTRAIGTVLLRAFLLENSMKNTMLDLKIEQEEFEKWFNKPLYLPGDEKKFNGRNACPAWHSWLARAALEIGIHPPEKADRKWGSVVGDEIIKSLIGYEKETGRLYRKRTGELAGTPDNHGYLNVQVRGKVFKAHRMVFFFENGVWPISQIDHINGIKDDNRFVNLRECSRSQNMANRGLSKINKTGYKGVFKHQNSKRWSAKIGHNGIKIMLGYFRNPEEAYFEYCIAAIKLKGEFVKLD